MNANVNDNLTAAREAIEAERREFLKPKKRFEKFFQELPVRLSKATRREMMIAALCTAEALRGYRMPDQERLKRAEMTVLHFTFGFYLDEHERRQRQAPKRKAA